MLVVFVAASAAGQDSVPEPADHATTPVVRQGLRIFTVDKPAELLKQERATEKISSLPLSLPPTHDLLHTTVGVGFVQGADWGSELLAGGAFKGVQIQADSLVTQGNSGLLVDRGSISLFDPDRQWRVEAGDVFSTLRGISRGARFSWQSGEHRPAISVYAPRRGTPNRTTVVSYRDQIHVGPYILFDGEAASDRSFVLGSRWAVARFDVEASYRSTRNPAKAEDSSVAAGLNIWHGLRITAGSFQIREGDGQDLARTVSLRLPFSRVLDLTLERTFNAAGERTATTNAATASLSAGGLRMFHRYQTGKYDYSRPGFLASVSRRQTQSMASYTPLKRLNLTLQLATQRSDLGQTQSWEELQTTIRLTRGTTVQTVTAVPEFSDARRLRASFEQALPRRFALHAEYGRLASYQDVPDALERSRLKVMLYKTWDVATPSRGAEVRGRVVDPTGRPVAGARVKLGAFTAETDQRGDYQFRNVPRGEYGLSLDPQFLPADYAWDGRDVRLTLSWSSRIIADMRVTPLNAVHGRVYQDRNGNGQFDADEGVAGLPVQLAERQTVTDSEGAYSFYNVWPGTYTVRVDTDRLPPEYEVVGSVGLTVTLADGQPVTGADFRVTLKAKPILWQQAVAK